MFSLRNKKGSTEKLDAVSVLVVCTGNICRSPMAAGQLKHRLPESIKDRVTIGSAGTHGLHGNQAEPPAVRTMASIGVDITGHRARQLSVEMVRNADVVVVMEQAHIDAIKRMLLLGKAGLHILGEFGPHPESPEIDDPYGRPIEAYQRCLETITPCIDGLIRRLETMLDPEFKESRK